MTSTAPRKAASSLLWRCKTGSRLYFRERALYYLSQAVARQGERGSAWKFDLKAVYGVFFLNFRLDGGMDKLRTDVVLADRDTHEQFSDKLRFIYLQLPFFHKSEEECENDFERWIYVLKNMETLQRMPFKARKAVFEKLEQIVDIASLSKEERIKYDESIKVYRDNLVTLDFALTKGYRQGLEKGMAEGLEKGMEKGLEKGMAEGLEKGRAEMNRENALKLKEQGVSPEIISRVTGLSLETIETL